MGSKLFFGGLAWATTETTLRAACEKFGEVEEVRIIMDRATGRSKGFGFVTFTTEDAANKAKAELDGALVDGRAVKVDFPREREDRGPGGGGGYGGGRGGGYGGGGDRGGYGGGGDRGGYGGGGGGYGGGGGGYGGGGGGYGGGAGGDRDRGFGERTDRSDRGERGDRGGFSRDRRY